MCRSKRDFFEIFGICCRWQAWALVLLSSRPCIEQLSSSFSELLYVSEELLELVPGLVWAVINSGEEEPTRSQNISVPNLPSPMTK